MSKKIAVVSAVLLVAAGAFAAPPQAIARHARRLLDVRGGSVAEAYIVVRGERIESISKSAPADAKVIQLGNATVLPGLIDCHSIEHGSMLDDATAKEMAERGTWLVPTI